MRKLENRYETRNFTWTWTEIWNGKKKKWVLILFIGMKIENIVYVWNGKEEKKFFGMLGEMWMRWL